MKPKKSLPHTLRRFTAHVAASDDATVKVGNHIHIPVPGCVTVKVGYYIPGCVELLSIRESQRSL